MIKILPFTFDRLNIQDFWRYFCIFGNYQCGEFIMDKDYRNIPKFLHEGEVYQVAMDQSTTNTGIFIKNYTNTEAYMIEVSRIKGQDADDYIFKLEMFLHRIFEGMTVSHLLYERPINTDTYRSSQVLFQLEGNIRGLVRRYPEFRTATLDCIENSSWRRVVIQKQFKDLKRKESSRASVEALFPWTSYYLDSLGNDNDIFEAIGIMFGWFTNSFDALGRPYVRGSKFIGNIGGFVLPECSAQEVSDQLVSAGFTSTWYMQNPRYSTYQNLVAGVEKYKVVCIELTDPYAMLTLSVECNLKWLDYSKMTVVLVAANYIDNRLFEITGKEYHFVL